MNDNKRDLLIAIVVLIVLAIFISVQSMSTTNTNKTDADESESVGNGTQFSGNDSSVVLPSDGDATLQAVSTTTTRPEHMDSPHTGGR